MIERLAVIKTGWCDSYNGGDVDGNFDHLLKGGEGAERFNTLQVNGRFQVYALPKGEGPPLPKPASLWTIVHVARDPAAGKMKMVGWYEGATFLSEYANRRSEDDVDRSVFCIDAEKAFEILPADRPVVDHGGRFGSSGVFWLRGNDGYKPAKPWNKIAARLEKLIAEHRAVATSGAGENVSKTRTSLGDTRRPINNPGGIEADDGGTPFGRGPESAEHKALRLWARDNPDRFVGDHDAAESKTEWPMPSGDRVDAMHRAEGHLWLIEAKSRNSGEKDKERGIFQCVKYRAVAEAVQVGQSSKAKVHAILLTEVELSPRLKILAKRHNVDTLTYYVKN